MDKFLIKDPGNAIQDRGNFDKIFKTLQSHYPIQATGIIDFNLGQFEVFKHHLGFSIEGSYVIKNTANDCYILLVKIHFKNNHSENCITECYEYQTWALSYLKHDFGRVKIKRERLSDKIIELVHPVELDFADDKPFSDTFYVLVNDHAKAVAAIDRSFRNAVMDIREDDFLIEIVEHTLIIGNKKAIDPIQSVHLADFVSRLCTTC